MFQIVVQKGHITLCSYLQLMSIRLTIPLVLAIVVFKTLLILVKSSILSIFKCSPPVMDEEALGHPCWCHSLSISQGRGSWRRTSL